MPADSLMPKPKSGGTGYVIAAVVMFALMGGLIIWKTSQGKAEPQPAPATETSPTASPPKVLEAPPPPPPPPEEVEDAGADADAPKSGSGTKRVSAGVHGCAAPVCSGTAGADLRSAMQSKAGQARSCYQNALRTDSTLAGRLTVGVRIGTNGLACIAGVTSDSMGNPQVSACVTRLFRAGKFPKPNGGCVDMAVPMNFQQKK